MNEQSKLIAKLEWDGNCAEFSGDTTSVWQSINRFFEEINPKVHSITQLVIKLDFEKILEKLSGLVFIDKDVGPVVDADAKLNNLTDSERIVFVLLMQKICMVTGFSEIETLTVKEVTKESKAKSAGVLLSQLSGEKIVQNIGEPGKTGQYRITDYGVTWFLNRSISKLREED